MDPQTIIAKRIALELRDGMLVNLGIGIPDTGRELCSARHAQFSSSRRTVSSAPARCPSRAWSSRVCTDAGGRPVSAHARRVHVRQRHVVRLDPRRSRRHDRARRLAGRSARQARQLDDSGQDGSGHGRRNGPRVRREARRDRDAAHREGQPQGHAPLHAAAHFRSHGGPRGHRPRGHFVSRRTRHSRRDGARRVGGTEFSPPRKPSSWCRRAYPRCRSEGEA